MTYVLAEFDISFPKFFLMLNTNLASICRYHAYFNRYLLLTLLIKKFLTIFIESKNFTSAINAGHFDAFFNAVCEYCLTLAISITVFEKFFKNWENV